MDEEMRDYLQTVRAHRAELADSVAAVLDALAGPLAVASWRERVHAAIVELAHDWRDHRALTEGDHGLYADVRESAPHLCGAADRLLAEHVEVSGQVRSVIERLEVVGPIADVEAFREEVTALMGRLVRHRQRGSDLVYAAYSWDLGVSG